MILQQTTMFGVRGEWVKVRPPRQERCKPADGRGRHPNSLLPHDEMQQIFTGRRAQIVAWLTAHGPATDRQVRDGLYGHRPDADMNMVRPRITELLDAGALREAGTATDEATGMTVRRVAVTGGDEGMVNGEC